MNWNTLEWVLGIGLVVLFLFLMLRGCGGMMSGMGGCGMPRERKHRRQEREKPHEPDDRGGGAGENRGATEPRRANRQDQAAS